MSKNKCELAAQMAELEHTLSSHPGLQHLTASLPSIPVTLCRTLHEFIEPQVAVLNISESIRRLLVDNRARILRAQLDEGINTRGIYLPGAGCFVNGYGLAHSLELEDRADLFASVEGVFELAATIIHEKYGHGFVAECTTAGRENTGNKLYQLQLAAQFQDAEADCPENNLVTEKMNIVFETSRFLEEGWAVWLENHTIRGLADKLSSFAADSGESDETALPAVPVFAFHKARETGATISRYGNNKALRQCGTDFVGCLDYLTSLALPACCPDPEKALLTARALQLLSGDQAFCAEFEYEMEASFPHYLGCLLFLLAENKFGAECLMELVALACNIELKIADSGLSDLTDSTRSVPNGNIDARLIQLLSLPSQSLIRDDREGLRALAWNVLSFPGQD